MFKIMTAGPTQVRENVRMARSLECTNPDLDMEFFDFYHETCAMLSKVTNTENKALILRLGSSVCIFDRAWRPRFGD